mgnify:CR=1 FL=1
MLRIGLVIASIATLVATSGCNPMSEAEAAPKAPGENGKQRKVLRKLLRDKPFPVEARNILNSRMQQHAVHMEKMLWSALVLDYQSVQTSAEAIAAMPKIARPTAGPQDPLNSLLPERFFELQDDLFSNAAALAIAAKDKDDKKIAESFSALGATSMSCHSLYLRIAPTQKK